MLLSACHYPLLLAGLSLTAVAVAQPQDAAINSQYFVGRWAFVDENCDAPTNWTIIGGGIFVSEDLTGKWVWADERLTLNLTDMAIDEETGEKGGRFQMDGPVTLLSPDAFKFLIDPDIYEMKRCVQAP